jgi:hypothetical protein
MRKRDYLKAVAVLSAAAILSLYGSLVNGADAQSVTVLVTYHSGSGSTEKMATGCGRGREGCI